MISAPGFFPSFPEIMLPLLRHIRTKEEGEDFRGHVAELEAALFRSDSKGLESILRAKFSENMAEAMRTIFQHPEFINHPEAMRTFFKDLMRMLESLPLLKLTLAFRPTEAMTDRLHDWVSQNLGNGILLDIGYDPSILGGARMIVGGKYKQIILAQMITDVLAKENTAIKKIIYQ